MPIKLIKNLNFLFSLSLGLHPHYIKLIIYNTFILASRINSSSYQLWQYNISPNSIVKTKISLSSWIYISLNTCIQIKLHSIAILINVNVYIHKINNIDKHLYKQQKLLFSIYIIHFSNSNKYQPTLIRYINSYIVSFLK